MAEKNQPGISQKIKILCSKYSLRFIILNEDNGKTLISSVARNLSKALRGCPRKNREGKFWCITDCSDFFSGR